MLRLYLGSAGCGKSAELFSRIAADAAAGISGSILIVPEQYSHENERRLCELVGDSACLYAEVLSFTRLASRVFAENGRPDGETLDAGGRLLVMYRALEGLGNSLTVYDRSARRPEFMTRLISAVDEFKSCLITPEQLMAASSQSSGSLAGKLHDLALIYSAYLGICEQGMFDPRDTLTRLAELVPSSELLRGARIYIDGFADFTMQELQVISALLSCGCDVSVALTCSVPVEHYESSGLFVRARRTAARLGKSAASIPTDCEFIYPQHSSARHPAIQHITKNLFSEALEKYDGEAPVELYSAASPMTECEYAAGRILELVKGGMRWRDIAVAARDFETYSGLLEAVFEKYGIPVYLSRMEDILQKPVLNLVVSALRAVSGGYEYDDMFRYLRTGLTNLTPEECDMLENYVLTWNIKGNLWTRDEKWGYNPAGYSASLTEADAELLETLDLLRRRAAAPLARLREDGKAASTALEQARALYDFLENISLPETLSIKAKQFAEGSRLQLADEYTQLWSILTDALDRAAEVLADMSMGQDDFSDLLKLLLSQYDVGSIPVSYDRVTVSELTRLNGRPPRCLIVVGASDDALPMVSLAPGLLTDLDRTELESLGIELLSDAESSVSKELDAIYTCFSMPSERLIVSCPAADSSGTAKRPSFVFKRLQLMFGLDIINEDSLDLSFRTRAPLPCLELAASALGGRGGLHADTALSVLSSRDDGFRRLDAILRAANAERGRLSRANVRRLYGEKFRLSASRAERLFSCRFSYFMEYGLKARARKRAGFQAPELGTFMHYILENVCREVKALGGFSAVDENALDRLTRQYVDRFIAETLDGFHDKTPRFKYLFNRLYRTVREVVRTMGEELSVSDFEPLDFELHFGRGGELPAIEVKAGEAAMELSGSVDRVDGWVHGGRLYLRVVDYKTGAKSFDLSDLWYGMGMQMLIYLFALQKYGAKHYGADEIVPAGVLYAPARDVTVSAARELTDEELAAKATDALKRSGLLLDNEDVISAMEHGEVHRFLPLKYNRDGSVSAASAEHLASLERFGLLSKLIDRQLGEAAQALADGSVSADPYYREPKATACTYCEYAAACQFDESSGDSYSYITKLKPAEVWRRLEKTQEEGNEDGISAD